MLTGAQKTKLRGIGQVTKDMLIIGQAGVTPTVLVELKRLLATHELVKLRFTGADRHQRAELCDAIATQAACAHIGSVGNTALFYLEQPDASKRSIEL